MLYNVMIEWRRFYDIEGDPIETEDDQRDRKERLVKCLKRLKKFVKDFKDKIEGFRTCVNRAQSKPCERIVEMLEKSGVIDEEDMGLFELKK